MQTDRINVPSEGGKEFMQFPEAVDVDGQSYDALTAGIEEDA